MSIREIIDIPVDSIKAQLLQRTPTDQGIIELTNSISQIGVIEPLIVVKTETEYILQAGKRRLTAAKAAGLPTVPCIVVEVDKEKSIQITLHENLYREDLNPVDEAWIYQELRDTHKYSGQEIARMIGRKEGYVSQRLQIVFWPDDMIKALSSGQISFSVARELIVVTDEKHRSWLLKHAKESGCNYRTARRWRTEWQAQVPTEEEKPDYTQPPPEPEPIEPVVTPCWWCGILAEIYGLVNIDVCHLCYGALKATRDKLEKKGS